MGFEVMIRCVGGSRGNLPRLKVRLALTSLLVSSSPGFLASTSWLPYPLSYNLILVILPTYLLATRPASSVRPLGGAVCLRVKPYLPLIVNFQASRVLWECSRTPYVVGLGSVERA